MNRTTKRLCALLLSLLLAASVFSGLTPTAYAAVGYNTGVRGKVCTELSAAAKAYYTAGFDYDTLSKLTGAALEVKLKTRMAEGYDGSNSYNGLKTMFQHTDSYQGSSSKMYFFYSGIAASNNMNREHVWPKSLSNGQFYEDSYTAGADVHHLRPADANVNSTRGNRPFGVVTGGTYQTAYTKTGSVGGYYNAGFFEPLDAVKGDCARIILYVYTRWDQRNINDVFQSTDLLLRWCELDPVDEFEMGRNDIAEQYTNSRNVYIDYPEYCWLVFGKPIPTHMTTPSGKAKTCNTPDYVATVTTAPTCTNNGVKTYTCKNCGYSYTEVVPASGHHYVNGVCTVCGKQQAATQYLYTASISAGDQVVILNTTNKKVVTTTASSYTNSSGTTFQQLAAASATIEGQELSCSSTAMAVFTVVKSGSSYAFRLDDGRYLTCEDPQNLTLTSSPKSGTNYWTLEDSGQSTYYLKNTTTYYETYQKNYQYLEFYAGKFTTYGWNGTNDGPYATAFYKQVAGAVCEHDYQISASQGATCTEGGFTSYQCTKCGDSYTITTDPLGHDFQLAETIPPTATEQGYDLYICTRCSAEEQRNFTDPTGEPEPKPIVFNDVPEDAYFAAPVAWAVENGITNGTDVGTFSPDNTCTRGQVVTFLWRANGSPEPQSADNPFTDVKEDDYFFKAVLWAKEKGITSGTSADKFSPEQGCTRAQVVTFLWRAEGKPAPAGTDNPFTDISAGQYYTDAVLWAVSHAPQITNGTSDTTFSPDKTCTRGQIVTFLYRDLG